MNIEEKDSWKIKFIQMKKFYQFTSKQLGTILNCTSKHIDNISSTKRIELPSGWKLAVHIYELEREKERETINIKYSQEQIDITDRIYNLINARRKMKISDWAKLFQISDSDFLNNRTYYVEVALNILDRIKSDDNLYHVCLNCSKRVPFDRENEKEGNEEKNICDCNAPTF